MVGCSVGHVCAGKLGQWDRACRGCVRAGRTCAFVVLVVCRCCAVIGAVCGAVCGACGALRRPFLGRLGISDLIFRRSFLGKLITGDLILDNSVRDI